MQATLKHFFQRDQAWWNYVATCKVPIRPVVIENVTKLLSCGLSVRGCATYACSNPNCTHMKVVCFTCKSRFCSSCGKKATAQWIHRQHDILPNAPWQHITFTMPKSLWRLFKGNRHLLNTISALAAQVIQAIAKKRGLIVGIFTALHTFGRDLKWNVHIHLSTMRVGLDANHNLQSIYFKKNHIMKMWRYRIIDLLRKAYKNNKLTLPESLAALCPNFRDCNQWLNRRYQQRWIIHCAKPSFNHHHNVAYLGRYIKRPPLAQSRLKHYDGRNVVFNYLDHRTKTKRDFHCSISSFIERLTQNIPEKYFRMIRYYGILSNRMRGQLLPIVYQHIQQPKNDRPAPRWYHLMKRTFGHSPLQCILCGATMVLSDIRIGKPHIEIMMQHKALALMKTVK